MFQTFWTSSHLLLILATIGYNDTDNLSLSSLMRVNKQCFDAAASRMYATMPDPRGSPSVWDHLVETNATQTRVKYYRSKVKFYLITTLPTPLTSPSISSHLTHLPTVIESSFALSPASTYICVYASFAKIRLNRRLGAKGYTDLAIESYDNLDEFTLPEGQTLYSAILLHLGEEVENLPLMGAIIRGGSENAETTIGKVLPNSPTYPNLTHLFLDSLLIDPATLFTLLQKTPNLIELTAMLAPASRDRSTDLLRIGKACSKLKTLIIATPDGDVTTYAFPTEIQPLLDAAPGLSVLTLPIHIATPTPSLPITHGHFKRFITDFTVLRDFAIREGRCHWPGITKANFHIFPDPSSETRRAALPTALLLSEYMAPENFVALVVAEEEESERVQAAWVAAHERVKRIGGCVQLLRED